MEKCSCKIGKVARALTGLLAVGALTAGVFGQAGQGLHVTSPDAAPAARQTNLTGPIGPGAGVRALEAMDSTAADFRQANPNASGRGIVHRGSPPIGGGGCQLADNQNGLNYIAFQTADNFSAAASGQITGVSWTAAFRTGTAAANFADLAPPATETFTIKFYNDAAGVPGTQLGATINVVNPTRTNSGVTLPVGPAPTQESIIWDYLANGIAGPNVVNGTCYWLEIRNTSVLPAGGGGSTSFWITGNGSIGDTRAFQSFTTNCNAPNNYGAFDVIDEDLTFCLSIALNPVAGNCAPPIIPAEPCINNPANGQGVGSASGTGYTSVTEGNAYAGAARFQRAEGFRVQTGGALTSVCFWGFFAQQQAGGALEACTKIFDIRIYNVGGDGLPTATPIGDYRVGTGGVTLQRGFDANFNDQYQVNLPGNLILNANTCYYLSISHVLNASPNTQAAFVWGAVANNPGNPVLDNVFLSRAIPIAGGAPGPWTPTAPNPAVQPANLSYLINLGPALPAACISAPGNDTCATATTLAVPQTLTLQRNTGANDDALPGCGFDLVEGGTVWYTFLGTGNDVTVSTVGTCNANTGLDTLIHVYCSDSVCGTLNCVDGNDDFDCDANPATANLQSQVTVPTVSGNRYYVIVGGFGGAEGTFQIATSNGPTPSADQSTCASRAACVIDAEPFDFQEADSCGVGAADVNGACAGATIYPALDDIAKGTLGTAVNPVTGAQNRDIDLYRLPASSAGQTVVVSINAESPTLVQFQNDPDNDCATANTVIPGSGFGIRACVGLDVLIFEVALPATGTNYFLITVPSFDGNPCGTGAPNNQNDYRVQIGLSPSGACCVDPQTACSVSTLFACFDGGGVTLFPGLACSLGGIDPCTVTSGSCCLPDNTCSFVPSANTPDGAACTGAGGTFTAAGVCDPNPCGGGGTGACCCGTTCSITTAAACTGANTFFAGGGACNAPGNPSAPCCITDYNKSGGAVGQTTVQDIFDFLGGYFASDACADINGGGTSVQDIFDFLSAYFAAAPGGC